MVAVRKDYAAPTGLDFILVWGSTKMPRRWRWEWPSAKTGRTQGPGQKANGQRMAGPGPDWPALPELGRAQTRMQWQNDWV